MAKSLPKKDMNHLYKITQSLRNVAILMWATFVAYVVYVEFVKDLDGIIREPWATGRVSTSGTQWLHHYQGKDFHRSPWYSKLWTKIKSIRK